MEYTPANQPEPAPRSQFASALGSHRKLLIAAVVLLVAFGYFGFTAFSSATAYYMTVDEVVALGDKLPSQSFQVKGRLTPASFAREEGTLLAQFTIEENGARLQAAYDGVVPSLFFNEHSEIVLNGQFDLSGLFVANRILVKCPSKYQSIDEVPERYITDG
jgi:cytochrome c-type biogenesis protein CcmE